MCLYNTQTLSFIPQDNTNLNLDLNDEASMLGDSTEVNDAFAQKSPLGETEDASAGERPNLQITKYNNKNDYDEIISRINTP